MGWDGMGWDGAGLGGVGIGVGVGWGGVAAYEGEVEVGYRVGSAWLGSG